MLQTDLVFYGTSLYKERETLGYEVLLIDKHKFYTVFIRFKHK